MSNNKHLDAPDHWFGTGLAPNFSRRVAQASEAVHIAKKNLLDELKNAYPKDRRVTVIHYRGQFRGRVVGWNQEGCRVAVENDNTLKVSLWWAAHVQLELEEP